jgi:hypothetical protein
MQLEFFGENFDRHKCNETCDNCKAGRVPDERDMTAEMMTIMNLLSACLNQRRTGGVTLFQLSELYRGSKAKQVTNNFTTNGLRGYGAGSKYKKQEIERITHAMIFHKILVEESQENNGGFMSDYVRFGEEASTYQNGSKRFFVDFPNRTVAKKPAKKSPKKAGKSKSTGETKKNESVKKAPGKTKKVDSNDSGGLQFAEIDLLDDSDDDSVFQPEDSDSNQYEQNAVLPPEHTKALVGQLKSLVIKWADEEQSYGNDVFCKYIPVLSRVSFPGVVMLKLCFVFAFCFFRLAHPSTGRDKCNRNECSDQCRGIKIAWHSWREENRRVRPSNCQANPNICRKGGFGRISFKRTRKASQVRQVSPKERLTNCSSCEEGFCEETTGCD